MTVNFNNLRKQALYTCDSLTEKLNNSILKETQYAQPNDAYNNSTLDIKGYVLIDAKDIQKQMDELRSLIGSIAMTYEPTNEDFKDIYSEVYPGREDNMTCFNEED